MDKSAEEGKIQAFLREMADAEWNQSKEPYLLSMAAPKLKDRGIIYREVLGQEKLKAFAKRTGSASGYRVVEHPLQKAKVGIVPEGAQFEFPPIPTKSSNPKGAPAFNRERIVIEFLRALSNLSDEELKTVSIPTRVLAKLLTGQ